MPGTKRNEAAYRVTLTGGAVEMKNRIVTEPIALQIIRIVMGDQGVIANPAGPTLPIPPITPVMPGALGTPKQFYSAKKPTTDVERVTVLAYYLTYARDKAHFKTIDLTKLNTEAAGPKLSNATAAARNAVTNRLLALAGKGQKQISPLGEEVVNALPDRDAVKTVLAAAPKAKKRKPAKRSKKSR